MGEDGVAATDELAEHDVGGWDPLDDEMAGGEIRGEAGDFGERDVVVEEEVMDDGEHDEAVECAGGAGEE